MLDLLVVSNRLPPVSAETGNHGGLAVGLFSALRKHQGRWLGWNGEINEWEDTPANFTEYAQNQVNFLAFDLYRADYENYYRGFANEVLWPLLHYQTHKIVFNRNKLFTYLRVNRLFAQHILNHSASKTAIWIHDYQLIAVGAFLRAASCKQPIGFFLHTPFPPRQVLKTLPGYEQLLKTLLAYDLIGLQTQDDRDNLIDALIHELGAKRTVNGVRYLDQHIMIKTYPISVDVDEIQKISEQSLQNFENRRLSQSLIQRPLIIGVDRLDYSKGIIHRFKAFERLLQRYPAHHNQVVFMQIAPPSRTDISEYIQLRRQLERMAGHINGRFSDYDWSPLRYLNKGYRREILMGFMRQARIALVTPLRDGMNLVAKEFIAAQDPDDPGVLILSDTAGASAELKAGALVCNPHDIDHLAALIHHALSMSLADRKARWQELYETIHNYDIHRWSQDFLSDLESCARLKTPQKT